MSQRRADVVIVGAGGAGCVLAWFFVANNPPGDTKGGTITMTIG